MSEPTEEDLLDGKIAKFYFQNFNYFFKNFIAVKQSLKQDGRLGRFKAEMRSAVMSVLNKNPTVTTLPSIPEETKLINELLREYLVWNGYLYSEQTLISGTYTKLIWILILKTI